MSSFALFRLDREGRVTDSKVELAERVFDRIFRMGIQPHALNFFMVALILWDEDRQKISKGFNRAGNPNEAPARSTKHGIE